MTVKHHSIEVIRDIRTRGFLTQAFASALHDVCVDANVSQLPVYSSVISRVWQKTDEIEYNSYEDQLADFIQMLIATTGKNAAELTKSLHEELNRSDIHSLWNKINVAFVRSVLAELEKQVV